VINAPRSLENWLEMLASGQTTSRQLLEECLARANDRSGEGARVFTKIYGEPERKRADSIDKQHRNGRTARLLEGLPVSIKDLFDVAGETTLAGSMVLTDAFAASQDSEVVARLRNAGAILVGRTNMTEFAYSGLGLNPHHGTPCNPYGRNERRIPGGSSAGAAVSVSDGMAMAAIGSDTGGSVRIPAALCGLTGFKPTARRVPLAGVLPLSPSLDSVGSIAPSVACCARIDAVLSDEEFQPPASRELRGLRIGILQGCVLDDLEEAVAESFQSALAAVGNAGAKLSDVHFGALTKILVLNGNGGLPAFESYVWHRILIERYSGQYDPRVLSRILRGKLISAAEYAELRDARFRLIQEFQECFEGYDAWMMPTVPRIAPRIAKLESSDEAYFAANAAMLRNPSVVNFLDGCALSIPCQQSGEAPVGLMIAAPGGYDASLLRAGVAIEECLNRNGSNM
jgi:aspartyl-tRNA(Asn)/glutamyl-tRNA(Gln) amidotransferase subunit A